MRKDVQKASTNRKPRLKSAAKEAAYLALGVAMLTVCAWITVPLGAIPVTMQTFAVALIGALFGAVRGLIAVSVYLLMGLIGIPVFSNFNAGVVALLGPTGGYLIGFLFSTLIAGLFSAIKINNKAAKIATVYCGMLLGMLLCYFFGTLWFIAVYSGSKSVSVAAALMLCVTPYILPDAVKLFFAALLGVRLKPYVMKGIRK